jgi:hypothetical protein
MRDSRGKINTRTWSLSTRQGEATIISLNAELSGTGTRIDANASSLAWGRHALLPGPAAFIARSACPGYGCVYLALPSPSRGLETRSQAGTKGINLERDCESCLELCCVPECACLLGGNRTEVN